MYVAIAADTPHHHATEYHPLTQVEVPATSGVHSTCPTCITILPLAIINSSSTVWNCLMFKKMWKSKGLTKHKIFYMASYGWPFEYTGYVDKRHWHLDSGYYCVLRNSRRRNE
jgi:hypothetical protein